MAKDRIFPYVLIVSLALQCIMCANCLMQARMSSSVPQAGMAPTGMRQHSFSAVAVAVYR